LVVLVGVVAAGPAAAQSGTVTLDTLNGTGAENDPYVITNATQLQAMELDLDAYYALGNDVDASETAGWNDGKGFDPVGSESTEFAGRLDGRGHTIAGLTIDRPTESNVGMIGYSNSVGSGTANDELRDFALTNVSVVGNETVGAVFGFNVLTDIESVRVHGTVTGNESVGGVLGEGPIVSISNVTSNTTTTGADMVGGIIGTGYGQLSASSVTGSVSGETDVGGAAGRFVDGSDIENVTAAVTVSGSNNVGGLVGDLGDDIVDSQANGTVSGDTNVGGLVGQVTNEPSQYDGFEFTAEALLSNVSAAGNVTGDDAVGGLVGELTGGRHPVAASGVTAASTTHRRPVRSLATRTPVASSARCARALRVRPASRTLGPAESSPLPSTTESSSGKTAASSAIYRRGPSSTSGRTRVSTPKKPSVDSSAAPRALSGTPCRPVILRVHRRSADWSATTPVSSPIRLLVLAYSGVRVQADWPEVITELSRGRPRQDQCSADNSSSVDSSVLMWARRPTPGRPDWSTTPSLETISAG